MEIVIAVLVIANIATNFYLVHSLKSMKPVVLEPRWEVLPIQVNVPEAVQVNIPEAAEEVEEKPVSNLGEEKYQAWKNVTYEPKVAPPSPHRPAPTSGPLERPYGFPL